MTKFIITYDDRDPKLGSYFALCKENLVSFLSEKGISEIVEISTQHCTQLFIELKVNEVKNDDVFYFVAYSHGNNNSLVSDKNPYVKVGVNTHLFKNSVFYTNACLCGRELKSDLILNGTKTFIGYKEETNVLLQDAHLSAKLDNYALLLFIESDRTIHEAYISMLDYYDHEIDKLNDLEKGLGYGKAAYLTDARDALVFDGDKNYKFVSPSLPT